MNKKTFIHDLLVHSKDLYSVLLTTFSDSQEEETLIDILLKESGKIVLNENLNVYESLLLEESGFKEQKYKSFYSFFIAFNCIEKNVEKLYTKDHTYVKQLMTSSLANKHNFFFDQVDYFDNILSTALSGDGLKVYNLNFDTVFVICCLFEKEGYLQ